MNTIRRSHRGAVNLVTLLAAVGVAALVICGIVSLILYQSLRAARAEVEAMRSSAAAAAAAADLSERDATAQAAEATALRAEQTRLTEEAERDKVEKSASQRTAHRLDGGFTGAASTNRREDAEKAATRLLESLAGLGKPKSDFTRTVLEEASRSADELFGEAGGEHPGTGPIVALERTLGDVMTRQGLTTLAAHHIERAGAPPTEEASNGSASPDDAAAKASSSQLSSLKKLAASQARNGELDAAMATWAQALALTDSLSERSRATARNEIDRAMALHLFAAGRTEQAEPHARAAYEFAKAASSEVSKWSESANALARTLLAIGRNDDALAIAQTTLDAYAAERAADNVGSHMNARILQMTALHKLGRLDEERASRDRVIHEVWFDSLRWGAFSNSFWIEYLEATDDVDRAESIRWRAVRTTLEHGTSEVSTADIEAIAAALERAGKKDRAAIYRRWLDRRAANAAKANTPQANTAKEDAASPPK